MSKKSTSETESASAEPKRSPHTIRFFDTEWARIEAVAKECETTPAEFVRSAVMSAVEHGDVSIARLAPLIERTFRATYLVATRMRDEMLEAGEREKLEEMIQSARNLQAELLAKPPD